MLRDIQADFATALLAPGSAPPEGLRATPRRFAVYRNNVLAALVGALETRFAVSVRIVGQEFFRAMAADFVRAHPPRSPALLHYGADMPAFVEGFARAADIPYLADVMRLEIACSEAFHAADAAPATMRDLAALAPASFARARIIPHPAARLIASPHPVASIAATHAPGREPAPIESWLAEDVLVTRPALTVTTRTLPPGGHAFCAALFRGRTFEAALLVALAAALDFDTAAALAGLVTAGAILSFIPGESP